MNWQKRLVPWLCFLIIGLSGLILLGWALQVRPLVSLGAGLISIKANTALSFMLLATAAWLKHTGRAPWLARLLLIFTIGLSALVISQDLLGRSLGVDEFFFEDFDYTPENSTGPGRMSPLTAISFILLGFSLLNFERNWLALREPAILAVMFVGTITLISYPYQASSISGLFYLTTMAVQTALLFLLSAFTLFVMQPDSELKQHVMAADSLGEYTRRLLAAAVAVPFLLGWLVNAGEGQGIYDAASSKALIIMGVLIFFTIVVLGNGRRLRHQAERREIAELDFANAQLQLYAVVENSPSAIFTKGTDGKYQLVNQNYADLLGRTPEEIIGKTGAQILDRDMAEEIAREDEQILHEGRALVSERRIRRGDTEFILLSTKFPLYDSHDQLRGIGGIWTDISERAKLIEDLRRSNAELEQFAYVASHDLQEPLRMVSSYMQLLESRYKDKLDEDAQEFIDFAVDGAGRMQRLIQDLLAFSRVGTHGKAPEAVQSADALEVALSNLATAIEENQAEVQAGELPAVMADFNQLVQVFQNLVGNAIKFRGDDPPQVRIDALRRGGQIQFSVADNGIGFNPKHAERIFVIFQRLNNRAAYGGTGIGLAICKKIIERLGGRIWVESKEGHGSTFYFTLPSAEPLGQPQAIKAEREAEGVEERAGRML